MRPRFLAALLVALTALLLSWLAVAPASAQVLQDSVTGAAFDCDQPACLPIEPGAPVSRSTATFNAASDPSGHTPSGTVEFGGAGGTPGGTGGTEASVTCLSVAGHVAIIGFTGRESGFNDPDSWVAGLIRVVDGGPPGSSLDTWQIAITDSEMTFVRDTPFPGPTDCSSFAPPFVPSPSVMVEGDIVVTDTQPLPTAKDQCKKGGWRTFGDTFKNQGQCVAFVQRGPNP
jgi:hypothetical protein